MKRKFFIQNFSMKKFFDIFFSNFFSSGLFGPAQGRAGHGGVRARAGPGRKIFEPGRAGPPKIRPVPTPVVRLILQNPYFPAFTCLFLQNAFTSFFTA